MVNPLDLVRSNILKLQPYSTARDECRGGDISVWLDANESPYNHTISGGNLPIDINRYPDPHQKELKRRIAEMTGGESSEENIFIGGAGSDEAIDLIYRIFCEPGVDNVIAIAPSYGVYSVAAAINDVEFRQVMLGDDFSLPVNEILASADSHTKILWICSPNNPTGNSFAEESIVELLRVFSGMVVVDEAYIHYSSRRSLLPLIKEYPNLIVLQTLSKAWGMASLRLGIAFASAQLARLMGMVKYPYNVNGPTQMEVLRQLERDISSQVDQVRIQREMLGSSLESLPFVRTVYPSDANFLLVKVDDAEATYDYLMRHGIIVRNRSSQPKCDSCLRITVGTPAENLRLMQVLEAFPCGNADRYESQPSSMVKSRRVTLNRTTSETSIEISVDLDSPSAACINTGLRFFDHMLTQIAHHGGIGLNIECKGDLDVDEHHTMEDVAIALGQALSEALGDKRGIERYGFVLPMDESRAMVLIDLGGRIDIEWDVEFTREYVGDTPTEMFRHFFGSLAASMQANIHISARGDNNHHLVEGIFKAFARALKMAIRREKFNYSLPSSKGVL